MSHADTPLHESQHPLKAALRVAGVIVAALFLGFVLMVMTKDRAKADSLAKPPVQKVQRFADPLPAAAPSWTGLWVGGHIGYDIEKQRSETSLGGGPVAFDISSAADAFAYGIGIGYHHQLNNVVLGVLTDFSFTNASKQSTIGACPACVVVGDAKIDRTWYAGAQIGYLIMPRALLFTSVGYTTVYSDTVLGVPTLAAGVLGDRGGITYGAGLEVLGEKGFAVKLEYRFIDLGNDSTAWLAGGTPTGIVSHVDTNIHQIMLGASLKFNMLSGAPLK